MSEQMMKILRMLEEGKITAAEANELLTKVEQLEEEASRSATERETGPTFTGGRHFGRPDFGQFNVPPVHIPDVHKIVSDALREAFGQGFPHYQGGDEGSEQSGDFGHSGAHFAGATLDHTDLTDARLDSHTRLEGADLRFAAFTDADLRGADLRGANLSYSAFEDTDFRGADLRGAQLHHGKYSSVDFRNADLHDADLSLSDLTDATFKGVQQPGLTLRGMSMVGMRYEGVAGADAPEEDTEVQTADVEVEIPDIAVTDEVPDSDIAEGRSEDQPWG